MKLLKNCYHKVHIHYSTVLYALLTFIMGYERWYLLALLIVCLHELCHLMMAYYFHFEIDKIEILPFGAYLSLHDFYYHSIVEELCVVMAGPCSHLLIYLILSCVPDSRYYDYLCVMNTSVFLFNLIPIYPMDGHRMICLILQSFLDLKEALYLSLKISVFSYVILSVCYLQTNTMLIIFFLFYQQFAFYTFIYQYLRNYYSQIPTLPQKRKKIIHDQLIYRRGYHNYYIVHSQLFDESQMMFSLLKNIRQK